MRSLNPRTGTEMTPNETIIYDALCGTAARGEVCPNYLLLNELINAESSSTSPAIVKRLEDRGLIRVLRFQRFREVQIVATGEWTMKSPNQQTSSPHVPRGARQVGSTAIVEQSGRYSINTRAR